MYQKQPKMKLKYSFIILLAITTIFLNAQPNITTQTVYTNFNQPLALTHAGDERIFIVQKEGKIICINTLTEERYTFLDIENLVSTNANERGLLGLAMDPDFQNNGHFFVNYTNNQGNTVIARFSLDSNNPLIASSASKLEIMTINQTYSNHNGGCIAFGKDNYLYIGNGDGGSSGDPQNASQNPQSLLGKMLRIDVSEATENEPYINPADNPYINDPAVRDEIWAFGLRNPWRFSFDKNNGDLWIGDVGQNVWEEVDYVPFEAFDTAPNFGWRCYEGFAPYNTNNCETANSYDEPVVVYNNDNDGCSITGGFVYRGCQYPNLYGYYLYIDYCSGRIWGIDADGDDLSNDELLGNFSNFNFASFGEDSNGELYLIGIANGTIYKIVETGAEISFNLEKTDPSCDGTEQGILSFTSSEDEDYWSDIFWNGVPSSELSINNLAEGAYEIMLQGSNGCQLSLTEEISNPSIIGSSVDLSTNNTEDSLIVNDIFDNYQWLINGDIQSESGPKIRISASGIYAINVWNNDRPDCILNESQDIISSVRDINITDLKLSPIPAKDQLFISGLEALDQEQVRIRVFDLDGKEVHYEIIELGNHNSINVSKLNQGAYLLKVECTDLEKIFVKKFVK